MLSAYQGMSALGRLFPDVPVKPGEIEKRLVAKGVRESIAKQYETSLLENEANTAHKLAALEKGDLTKMGFALGDLGVTLKAFGEWDGSSAVAGCPLSLSHRSGTTQHNTPHTTHTRTHTHTHTHTQVYVSPCLGLSSCLCNNRKYGW
jgi:hypothetical protein